MSSCSLCLRLKKKPLYVVQLTHACSLPTQSSAHCTNHFPSQLLLKAQRQDGDQPERNKTSLLSQPGRFVQSSRGACREGEDLILARVSWAPAEAGRHHTKLLLVRHKAESSAEERSQSGSGFTESTAPFLGEAHPVCHQPLPSALCTAPNTLPFLSAGYASHPPGGSPSLSTAPISCPWLLL